MLGAVFGGGGHPGNDRRGNRQRGRGEQVKQKRINKRQSHGNGLRSLGGWLDRKMEMPRAC